MRRRSARRVLLGRSPTSLGHTALPGTVSGKLLVDSADSPDSARVPRSCLSRGALSDSSCATNDELRLGGQGSFGGRPATVPQSGVHHDKLGGSALPRRKLPGSGAIKYRRTSLANIHTCWPTFSGALPACQATVVQLQPQHDARPDGARRPTYGWIEWTDSGKPEHRDGRQRPAARCLDGRGQTRSGREGEPTYFTWY